MTARTITNSRLVDGAKLDNAPTDTNASLAAKVDKVTGKGLSTNDYTTTEKDKLAGIEAGAQVNEVDEAPIDGKEYARKDGAWTEVTGVGGGWQVDSVVAGTNISVDDTDPANPVVSFQLGADENFVTDAEKTVLGNTSGTNTWDQDLSNLVTKSELAGYALNCDSQHVITDYTFNGTERRNSGYLVTTASNRIILINPDLFSTGYEVSICKGTDNSNTVTLNPGLGNNINWFNEFVLTQYNEVVTLLKDGASTWKIKSHYYPPSAIASPVIVSDQTGSSLTLTGAEKNNTFYVFTTSGAKTVTADPDLFPVGFRVGFQNLFSTSVSIDSTSGNVINNSQVYALSRGYQSVWLVKLQTNRWVVESDNFRYANEDAIILSNNTTNNASSSKHWFLPKLENTGTKYLKDNGTWATVSAGGWAVAQVSWAWPLVAGTLLARVTVTSAKTLAYVKASLGVLNTGASVLIDVRKNGTATTNSIFTSDSPLDIATSTSPTNGVYTVTKTAIDNGAVVENNVLYIYATQVGSGVSGADLYLEVN